MCFQMIQESQHAWSIDVVKRWRSFRRPSMPLHELQQYSNGVSVRGHGIRADVLLVQQSLAEEVANQSGETGRLP